MSETPRTDAVIQKVEALHDDHRQDMKLLALEISRLRGELSAERAAREHYERIADDRLLSIVEEAKRAEQAETQAKEYREKGQRLLEAADGWKLRAEQAEARAECERLREDAERLDFLENEV